MDTVQWGCIIGGGGLSERGIGLIYVKCWYFLLDCLLERGENASFCTT